MRSRRPAVEAMKHWDTVAIVGVGLIGGSIGLALRDRKLAENMIGVGRRPESCERQLRPALLPTQLATLPQAWAKRISSWYVRPLI